jgi:hypothetical protein
VELTHAEEKKQAVIYLPCHDFRDSARALSARDLSHTLRTASEVWHLEERYREHIAAPESGPSRWATIGWSLPRIKYAWAQWREFPAALAMYGYELERVHRRHRRIWATPTDLRWRTRVDAHMQVGTEWSAALGRKWKNQIDWLGDPRLHSSHKAMLFRKQPTWYRQYGWARRCYLPRLSRFGVPHRHSALLWVPEKAAKFAAECVRKDDERAASRTASSDAQIMAAGLRSSTNGN